MEPLKEGRDHSLVDIEHYLQELGEEVHVIRKPLLIEEHHPSDQQ